MSSPFMKLTDLRWLTVSVEKIVFPPLCIDCCNRADHCLNVRADKVDLLTAVFSLGMIGQIDYVNLPVPVCEKCTQQVRRRGRKIGLIAGILVGMAIATFVHFCTRYNHMPAVTFPLLTIVTAVVFYFAGGQLSYKPPIQTKRYKPAQKTLMLRFRNPRYQEIFVAQNRGNLDVPQ
jgi:hypothetical protein